jgi:site-specific recombinase XerD
MTTASLDRGAPSPLDILIEDYLTSCRARGLANKTVALVYTPVLVRKFAPWARGKGIERIEDVTQRVVDRWSAGLHAGGLKPASIHSYTRTLNGFLTWVRNDGARVEARGQLPKLPQRVVRTLTRQEIQRVEDQATNERDALIVRLLADTGIRVGELCALRVENLGARTSQPTLLINGKGAKQRQVPLSPALADRIRRHIRRRPQEARTDHIFLSRQRSRVGDYWPLQPSGVGQFLRELGVRAGTPALHPHLLRHSYATHCLAQNMNIEVLRRILGHEDTTLISRTYGHLVTADLHRAAMAALVNSGRDGGPIAGL